jgi:parallel beta-helix repeat protein
MINSLFNGLWSTSSVSSPSDTQIIVGSSVIVNPTMTTAQIQAIISNTAYSSVEFAQGVYTLSTYLNINRNNIVLIGNKCTLQLASVVNQPCIFIGDIVNNPPQSTYTNITILDFIINGNAIGQTQYTSTSNSTVANSCIGMTSAMNVSINRCQLTAAYESGISIYSNSKFVTVDSCQIISNQIYGIEAYDSSQLIFRGNSISAHTSGSSFGILMDLGCGSVVISDNIISHNYNGISAKQSTDVTMTGNIISSNSVNGLFCSGHNTTPVDNGCARWTITSNSFVSNTNLGLLLESCSSFSVVGNSICSNGTGISVNSYSYPNSSYGVSSQLNITGNVICNNSNYGFDNTNNNTYSLGARNNFLTLNIIKSNGQGSITGVMDSWTQDDDTVINTANMTLKAANTYTTSLLPNASITGNMTLTLPSTVGVSGQTLHSDGTGNLVWA